MPTGTFFRHRFAHNLECPFRNSDLLDGHDQDIAFRIISLVRKVAKLGSGPAPTRNTFPFSENH